MVVSSIVRFVCEQERDRARAALCRIHAGLQNRNNLGFQRDKAGKCDNACVSWQVSARATFRRYNAAGCRKRDALVRTGCLFKTGFHRKPVSRF